MTARFSFAIPATDGRARTGTITMKRGEIRTPAFMPVGTAATVKAMKPGDVRASGADIILGNTYHLMLRPGAERVNRLGGLHGFMGWDRPILTDSGGYQVMSLAELTKRSEDGVAFKSHLDGTRHLLSPERSIEIQRLLGSNIVMAFDELVPTTSTREVQASAMERVQAAPETEALHRRPTRFGLPTVNQVVVDVVIGNPIAAIDAEFLEEGPILDQRDIDLAAQFLDAGLPVKGGESGPGTIARRLVAIFAILAGNRKADAIGGPWALQPIILQRTRHDAIDDLKIVLLTTRAHAAQPGIDRVADR